MEPIRVELFTRRREIRCKKMNEPKDYMRLAHQHLLVSGSKRSASVIAAKAFSCLLPLLLAIVSIENRHHFAHGVHGFVVLEIVHALPLTIDVGIAVRDLARLRCFQDQEHKTVSSNSRIQNDHGSRRAAYHCTRHISRNRCRHRS